MIWSLIAAMVVAFFFAGLETGLASVNRIRLRQRARQGLPEAVRLEDLLRQSAGLFPAILILHLLARIMVLAFLSALLAQWMPSGVAVWLFLLLLPALALLLEFLPKLIFRESPYRRVLLLAGILRWIALPLTPLAWLARRAGVGGVFPAWTKGEGTQVVTPSEVRRAINQAVEDGTISLLQKHYLHSVLNTKSLALSQLSEPLDHLPAIAASESVPTLIERAGREGADIFLVKNTSPSPLGAVFVFDLLLDGIHSGSCQSYMRRIPTLDGAEAPIIALLKMRAARASVAFVKEDPSSAMPRLVFAKSIVAALLHGVNREPS